jgi:exopolyphosphatase/guanosine-5'-triphosphate,3'-diphosphate pyrophosphatase
MEPLSAATGLSIEYDERLAEGGDPRKALEALPTMADGPIVLCSHGSLIVGLLSGLEDRGAHLETNGRFRCQKGSIWLVEEKRGAALGATYRSAPRPKRNRKSEVDRELIAVLDLGSTSFRVVLFEATRAGVLKQKLNERDMLRLGAAIDSDGRVPEKVCNQAIATARRLSDLALGAGASRVLPVATAALRSAGNGRQLSKKIGKALGTDVRVLSGDEEAALLFRAFQRRVPLTGQVALGFDLGGGSLELAIGDAREIRWTASLPIGVTRLHRELVTRDPMRKRDVRKIRECLLEALEPHRSAIAELAPQVYIASGGSARAFGDLAQARLGRTRADTDGLYEMSVDELGKLTRKLVRVDHDERMAIPGVRKDRVDLMPTGGILITALAEALDIDAYTTCDWGLREGVVLEALGVR